MKPTNHKDNIAVKKSTTPRTDRLRDELAHCAGSKPLTYHMEQWLLHSKQLELEVIAALDREWRRLTGEVYGEVSGGAHTDKPEQPMSGPGWRIRKLIDGRYVAEVKQSYLFCNYWAAVDLKIPNFRWSPDDIEYHDCIGTYEECIKALAGRGF